MTPLEYATKYHRRGWQPIPIPHRSKNPNFSGWQKFQTTEADLPKHFNGAAQNVGVLLHDGLTDIDLDSSEAILIADYFLPPTDAVFGRASKMRSHRIFKCKGAAFEKFNNPFLVGSKDEKERKNACIVELRTGNGLQTVFPGSMHESGEAIEWHTDGEALEIDALTLRRAVGMLASSCLLASFWRDGIRQDLAVATSGALLRNGFDVPATKNFIRAVCAAANDEEISMRLKSVDASNKKIKSGGNVYGFPKLAEFTDTKLVETICKWLQIEPRHESQTESDYKDAENGTRGEIEETETKIKTFPVPSAKCFDGLAGDFVRLAEPHTEASLIALLSQFLVYFGNIVGRSAHFKVEGDKHFTNLFCVLVGKTASGRKGTSFGRVREVFRGVDISHETDCLTSGLASGEGLLWHIRDAVYEEKTDKKTKRVETVCTDSGVSDKRLLVVEGEFSQVLRVQGREGNTLSSFIRNLWDTGTAKSLTKNSPLRATDAHVSIVGHITRGELVHTLSEVDAANGYANRIAFFAVERTKFLPFGSDIPEIETGKLRARIIEAVNFAKAIEQMTFTPNARKLWASHYQRLETSRFGYLAKITQRASPYVLRFSCIFALLDQSSQIKQSHLERALAVWQYSEDSARYIFGERLADQTAEKILTKLKENQENGLTRTEIRDLFDRHLNKEKIDLALQSLLENGLARVEKEETRGRPKETWFSCVLSDISDISPDYEPDEQPFVAYVANNATGALESEDFYDCLYCGTAIELAAEVCPKCDKTQIPSF
jgi:rubrerythrin